MRAAATIALLCALAACAETGTVDPDQYKRTEWNAEQGLASGRIQTIAQTPDGYLWVGTTEGLLRFDGIRFVAVLTDQKRPLRQILGLTVDKAGALWVRAADTRLRQVRRDSIAPPVAYDGRVLSIVTMGAAQTAGIYATETRKTVLHLTRSQVETLPLNSKSVLISIAEASDHILWIGTDRGLLSWSNGSLKTQDGDGVDQKINCLLPDDDGHLWVGTDDGIAFWNGQHLVRRPLSKPDMQHLQILTLMKDRDNNLWAGTSRGLLRYGETGEDWVQSGEHDAQNPVTALMQDREGDIWFGAGSTLQRLQSTPVISLRPSVSTFEGTFGPLYVDHRGRVWFAGSQHGLYYMDHSETREVSTDGLAKDQVYSIDGDGDNIWIGRRNGGLTRLRVTQTGIESHTWTTKDGLSENSAHVVRVGPGGTVWIGTLTGGADRMDNGHFVHFGQQDGLPASDVSSIELGKGGDVWIGTSGGACRVKALDCQPLHTRTTDVLSLLADPAHGLWIGTTKGLYLSNDRGSHLLSLGEGPQPRVSGLALDKTGTLWIMSDRGIMSAAPSALLSSRTSSIRTYGNDDGLESSRDVRRSRSVVTDGAGQVWFTTAHQLGMVKATRTPLPSVIPHVEEVSADGIWLDRDHVEVVPGTRRLRLFFTGLDLHAPGRVRFRYRLDHFDQAWSEATSNREAAYTNLPPGKYTFRLSASNEADTWSTEESRIGVIVEPYLWQRWPIRIVAIVLAIIIFSFAYNARTRFLLAQVNILAEERLRERTRIARDIHDTLLQGFISSLMHLHVAERQIPDESPLKKKFSSVLEGMERVIEEARLAVVGLRTPREGNALEGNLREFFQEIADIGNTHFTMHSTGSPRPLRHDAFEHISFIAREAILNAVRHADANQLQVLITWGWRKLNVSVLDDGRGMEESTLQHGRPQHWGLIGMRERASQMKARLNIRSSANEGTRVSLSVSSSVAYLRGRQPNKTT